MTNTNKNIGSPRHQAIDDKIQKLTKGQTTGFKREIHFKSGHGIHIQIKFSLKYTILDFYKMLNTVCTKRTTLMDNFLSDRRRAGEGQPCQGHLPGEKSKEEEK